jgi:glycosyltransferase involved in cell wall biosynthesis
LKLIRVLGKSGRKLKQVVISEKIKQDYLAIFPQISFSVVENGIKMMGHAARENKELVSPRKKLLAIGHFGPAKRFDALVDTLGLAEVSMKYSLAIIGEEKGEDRPVTKYILSKALENVVLLGLKENVQDYLKDADALIIWSSFEGMPLVMLEALSLGCPIISTPVGGIPDVIVTGVNGILTTGLEQVDLVNALNQFYELTAVELDNIRKNNQELFIDRFSIESCAKNYECLFSVKE